MDGSVAHCQNPDCIRQRVRNEELERLLKMWMEWGQTVDQTQSPGVTEDAAHAQDG